MTKEYEELEAKICDLVRKSLEDRQYKDFVKFPLSEKTIKSVWKKIRIDLRFYFCVIHSDEIRHIDKEHPDDINHICKIPYHLNKITKIEKSFSYNRKTNKKEPCLVINKFISSGKIEIVKVHLSREKVLKLKTLYEV